MIKNRAMIISLLCGVAGGLLADGALRFVCGNDGNLLVHTAVFAGAGAAVFAIAYIIIRLWVRIRFRKKG